MHDQAITFRELLAPVSAEKFFSEHYLKQPLHVSGPPDRFKDIFSWEDLNELLGKASLWSSKTLEIAKEGRLLPAEDYCYEGINRDNERTMRPDFNRVRAHLQQGASLGLNFIGRLTPGLRSISQTFEAVIGAPVNVTTFCSWSTVPAYGSHFDTTSVFVCQIAGSKRWNIYEGRMQHAAHTPGASAADFPQEHHERAKGRVLHEIETKAGDFLYIPHGQYHDAVATSEASLHISMAARHLVAHDFINLLSADLPKDPLFREHLPHIDAIGTEVEVSYRKRLAERLQQIITQPQLGQELRSFLHGKAFEGVVEFDLPNLGDEVCFYRVRWPVFRLRKEGEKHLLESPTSQLELSDAEAIIAEWVLDRDYFSSVTLAKTFRENPQTHAKMLQVLQQSGVIERMS